MQNQLITIGHGFNNAVANLYLNAQLAQGIRVAMTTYLSARHHQESWVKDGYFLIDESPIDNALLNGIMKYATLKVGHFEINYGDAHFRRSDNGKAMYNPFVGNYIIDAFTTEIGAEAYLRARAWLAMVGVTGGEVHGQVTAPTSASRATSASSASTSRSRRDLRVRLTGSMYANDQSASNTLYTGDRAGSRYYDVLENTASTETANAWSGAIQPGVLQQGARLSWSTRSSRSAGSSSSATSRRRRAGATELTQPHAAPDTSAKGSTASPNDQLYVGGRYNTVKGELARHRERHQRQPVAVRRRLVRHAAAPGEARVREPEVPRLPQHRHPQRRPVQGLHGRGRGRLLMSALPAGVGDAPNALLEQIAVALDANLARG